MQSLSRLNGGIKFLKQISLINNSRASNLTKLQHLEFYKFQQENNTKKSK